MNNKVLLVDDSTNLLHALSRYFKGRYDVLTALNGDEALAHPFKEEPVSVIVVDMRMPGMDGVELLKLIKDISPDTIRIMLTGNAEQSTAQDAVNHGHIFRFYTKPCPPDILAEGIDEAMALYNHAIEEHNKIARLEHDLSESQDSRLTYEEQAMQMVELAEDQYILRKEAEAAAKNRKA